MVDLLVFFWNSPIIEIYTIQELLDIIGTTEIHIQNSYEEYKRFVDTIDTSSQFVLLGDRTKLREAIEGQILPDDITVCTVYYKMFDEIECHNTCYGIGPLMPQNVIELLRKNPGFINLFNEITYLICQLVLNESKLASNYIGQYFLTKYQGFKDAKSKVMLKDRTLDSVFVEPQFKLKFVGKATHFLFKKGDELMI